MRAAKNPLRASLRALALLCVVTTAAELARGGASGAAVAAGPRARMVSALSARSGLAVDAGSMVFESGAPIGLGDALWGRSVLFTAPVGRAGLRDVFRARVRFTASGAVLSVVSLANLTRSPLGDDGPLVVEREVAPSRLRRWGFATRAFGQVGSVTVLDPNRGDDGPVPLTRRLTRWSERASFGPDRRWDLRLDHPAASTQLELGAGAAVRVAAGASRWQVSLDGERVTPVDGLTLVRAQEIEKPALIWAVDTVRALPFVGPAPIAWLEETVFGVRDRWRRVAFRYLGVRPSQAASEAVEEAPREGQSVATEALVDPDDVHWPPPTVAPPLGDAERGEGQWVPASPSWLRRLEGAPPAFYRSFLRLDRERPYARVEVLAIDARQIELGMQAGVEDPVPLVGPRGDGRIPRDPALMPRVVGAFNGAFKTEHGGYGMVVSGRVLLPPRPRAATVASFDDGTVALGSWGPDTGLPEGLVSLRQNLDPLVADGVENPTRRALWGFVLGGIESMPTVRSGLCGDRHGHLFYFWGEETTGRLLARTMRMVGCDYGLHLDMNPTHAAFHFLRVEDVARRQFQYQPLLHGMQSHGDRFLYYTLKDFFYLALRPVAPPPLRGVAWRTEALPEPAPRWLPSLHRLTLSVDQEAVEVVAMQPERLSFDLRGGRSEPALSVGGGATWEALTTLPRERASQLLGAFELGTARSPSVPRGLRVNGATLMPAGGGVEGYLGVALGRLVMGEGAMGPEVTSGVQARVVRRQGQPVARDPDDDARTVWALAPGRVFRIEGRLGREALDALLAELGARDAVALTRATPNRETHWRGAETLRDAYPSTTLFVLTGAAPNPVTRLEARRPAAAAAPSPQ